MVCEASNLSGSGKAAVQLAVHGKPSIPEDRLIVSNITASGKDNILKIFLFHDCLF